MKPQWLKVFVMTSLYLFAMAFFIAQAVIVSDITGARGVSVDYLIVPGETLESDGTLSARVCARLRKAASLYRENKRAVIVVSGGKTREEGQNRSELMREYLLEDGVPDSNIICESKGMELKQSILYSMSYITVDWYGLDEEIVLSPRVGLIMDNSFLYRYLKLDKSLGYHIYRIPVEDRWWQVPGAALSQLAEVLQFHLREAD